MNLDLDIVRSQFDQLNDEPDCVFASNAGGSYVWLVDSETMTVSQTAVTVGQLSGSEVEIVEGVSTGDRIAVSGVQHLAEDMRIRELAN